MLLREQRWVTPSSSFQRWEDREQPGITHFLFDPSASDFLDDVRDIVNAIIVRTGHEHDPHFNDAAELVLTAVTAFVVACSLKPEFVHFGTVRMLVSSIESFEEAIDAMRTNSNPLIAHLGGQCSLFQGEEEARF